VIRWIVAGLIACSVVAQADTGGSVGGGNWSRSSVPSTSGSTSSSGSTSTPTFGTTNIPVYTPPKIEPYHPDPHPYRAADDDAPAGSGRYIPTPADLNPDFPEHHEFVFDHFNLLFGAAVLFILGMWIKIAIVGDRPRADRLDRAIVHIDDTDVSVLRVALDGRARPFVQKELARIAGIANTTTDEGRVALLREVTLLVRRLRDAWVYGGADNDPIRDLGGAKAAFDHHVDDARVRFREETIRNEQGVQTRAAPSAYTPRSDEGAGLILVSIIIAARKELFTVKHVGNADELRRALEAAGSLDVWDLVALEIVWQPSEDTDRLSSMELEAKYPRPELVPIAGALVGKTFCTYCGGPFPAELVSCPHCGAPAPGRDRAAA